MKRIVTVDTATGLVIADWRGGEEQTLERVAGRTHLELDNHGINVVGTRWTGSVFEVVPVPVTPPRVTRADVAEDLEAATTIAGVKAALLPYFQVGA